MFGTKAFTLNAQVFTDVIKLCFMYSQVIRWLINGTPVLITTGKLSVIHMMNIPVCGTSELPQHWQWVWRMAADCCRIINCSKLIFMKFNTVYSTTNKLTLCTMKCSNTINSTAVNYCWLAADIAFTKKSIFRPHCPYYVSIDAVYWATVSKTVRAMLSDRSLSVLSWLSCLWRWCTVAKRLDGWCHLVWK